ncbi:hypothetical protein T439DRAFT_300958 [Meredithblackwellia eburnea MCA 4105]
MVWPFRSSSGINLDQKLNTSHAFLKVVNVLVFVFCFSSNLYGSIGGHRHGPSTPVTPSGYVFEIWSLIDLLLLGFVIYQFFDGSADVISLGWRFAILGILNSVFVHVYSHGQYLPAFILSLFVASAVSTIYYTLAHHHAASNDLDLLLIHLPFSLWHAWALVTVVISAFAAFTRSGNSHHPNEVVTILACIALAFFAITAWGYAMKSKKGDIAGALVLVWVLFGVWDHQNNDLIAYFALGCFIFAGLAAFKALWYTYREGHGIQLGGERAPLIA